MSNAVEIVIRAEDQFSQAFAALDSALGRAERAGRPSALALAGVGASLDGLVQASAAADSALSELATGAGERLGALDAERGAALEALAAQHLDVSQRLADNLLALDEAAAARRLAQLEGQFAREQQARQAHAAAVVAIQRDSLLQVQMVEDAAAARRLEITQQRLNALRTLLESHGRGLARTAKALAVAESLIAAYQAGAKALATVPYPFNLAAAAAVTAQGLVAVERIRNVPIAHGGLENVQQDATFLLQRGERVLSAGQNRELTAFLDTAAPAQGRGVTIEHLEIAVLPNATNAEALLRMDRSDLQRVVADRIIPMLDELARLGVRPVFTEANV